MLSYGANFSSGMKCCHLELVLSSGTDVVMWDAVLSSGIGVVVWDEVMSSGASVVVLQSGATVVIWCRCVMLSSVMVAPPFFVFPESFTTSQAGHQLSIYCIKELIGRNSPHLASVNSAYKI